MIARNIHTIDDHAKLLNDPDRIERIRDNISAGDVYIAKNVFSPILLARIKEYLIGIGRNSLPNYHPIEMGCPNFHRINYLDERAYVKGCFHQFVFFPWNQDVFDLFERSKEVFYMKNLLSNNRKDRFIKRTPEDGCVSRIAFQFYPQGAGCLNKHQDPADHHQLTVPTLTMSKKGVEFFKGGAYVETKNGELIHTDDISDIGDIVYFNAQLSHGVERIDPEIETDWTAFKGRWMMMFAINKLSSNTVIANAVDMERPGKK